MLVDKRFFFCNYLYMAKKKVKSATKSPKKSHGELFDKHPNLIWLLPIFMIIAVVAIIAYNNSMKPVNMEGMLDSSQIPQVNTNLDSTESAEPQGN